MKVYREDQKYLLNVYKRLPIEIVRAKGSYLYDRKRRAYLDMFSGIAVSALGHQHKKINQAIQKQVKSHLHLGNYFVSPSVVSLAKKLVDHTFASKVFFSNSGAEAVETAIKIAKKYGQQIDSDKYEIISLNRSYHGRTIGAISLTAQDRYQDSFRPLLTGVKHIEKNDHEALKQAVSNRTCAIFLEVIQGEGGIRMLDDSYLELIGELAKKHQFLIVLDEVQTGLMRTGKLFAYQYTNLIPDILTTAKALGGGLPLGATLVSHTVEGVLKPGDHGSTFGGNPLSCALGDVVLEEILKTDFQKELLEKSSYFWELLQELKTEFPQIIREVRGKGLMIGVDVDTFATDIQLLMRERFILIDITNDVLRLLPPLTITFAQLDYFTSQLKTVLTELKGRIA